MEEHVRNAGRTFIGLGVFGALTAIALVAGFKGLDGLLAIDPDARSNALGTIPFENLVAFAYVIANLVLSPFWILVGRAILNWRPWASTAAILLSIATLFVVPVGSVAALYVLWVMTLPETEPLFLNPPTPKRNAAPR